MPTPGRGSGPCVPHVPGCRTRREPNTRELLKRAGVRQTAVFVGETLRRAAKALYARRHGREALERFNKESPTWTRLEVAAQWDRDLGESWLRELLGPTKEEAEWETLKAQVLGSRASRAAGVAG